MRARKPGLILALALASPAFAEGHAASPAASERAPQLAYAGADATGPGAEGCRTDCTPRLAYALVDLSDEDAPQMIVASSAPAPLAAFAADARRGERDGAQVLVAVRSDEPAEQKLAGLVTIVAPAAAPAPARLPVAPIPPRPALAPAPTTVPAPAPAPHRPPPRCAFEQICR